MSVALEKMEKTHQINLSESVTVRFLCLRVSYKSTEHISSDEHRRFCTVNNSNNSNKFPTETMSDNIKRDMNSGDGSTVCI